MKATVTNLNSRVKKMSSKKSPEDASLRDPLRRQFFLLLLRICHSFKFIGLARKKKNQPSNVIFIVRAHKSPKGLVNPDIDLWEMCELPPPQKNCGYTLIEGP